MAEYRKYFLIDINIFFLLLFCLSAIWFAHLVSLLANFLFSETHSTKKNRKNQEAIMVIACALRWWENESEILLFNSFHIHYSNLMGLWERERRLHTCREP